MTYVPVVDVAYYQGDIDFDRLREAGIAGVIARASDGWRKGPDPRWHEYARGAHAAGLPLGSYWYQRPLDGNESAEDQARRWLELVAEADVPVAFLMLDVEWYWSPEYPAPLPPAECAAWLRRHIAELRRGWDRPIICYTSGPFYNAHVADPALAAELELVLARYPRGNTPPPSSPAEWEAWALGTGKRPLLPAGATGWAGWQFTSSLHGPDVGIEATRVDACLIRPEAWARWTETVEASPPPAPTPPPTTEPAPPAPPAPPSETVTVTIDLPRLSTSTPKDSDAVRQLQALLNLKSGRRLKVDGHYGPKTEGAVRDWQTFFGLTVDGWVGAQTWESILGLVAW